MADDDVKALVADIPCPSFDETAFVPLAKPLADCTVAIVTTAALHHHDQDQFERGSAGFRVLDGSRRDDLTLGHWSPNFDRAGFAVDVNVVLPLDRLDELVEGGRIGAVGPRHVAFAGNQDETMTTIRLDTGPAAAKILLDDGVDVVLLTPV